MNLTNEPKQSSGAIHYYRAIFWFTAAMVVLGSGFIIAARQYPGGFDWAYTVVSALASQKHNPQGSAWFAGGFGVAMALLLPFVTSIKKNLHHILPASADIVITILRIGLISGILLGAERLLIHDLSAWIRKGHELLGLISFLGFYCGVLGLLIQLMLCRRVYVLPVLLVASPLCAIGVTQLWLYLYQRDLGWVDISWREMGVPIWLSFAFWQWLAIVFLALGLLLLLFARVKDNKQGSARPAN